MLAHDGAEDVSWSVLACPHARRRPHDRRRQALPARPRQRPRRLRGRLGRGPRLDRRERGRQEHPDEGAVRAADGRRGNDRGRRTAGRDALRPRRHRPGHRDGAPALHAGRAADGGREPGPGRGAPPGAVDRHARRTASSAGTDRALRLRPRPRRPHRRAPGRPAAAGGDPQGAVPRRPHPDHGRADRRPDPAGDARTVRVPARLRASGERGRLHLAQARRGDGDLRSHERDARRPHGGHRAAGRHRRRMVEVLLRVTLQGRDVTALGARARREAGSRATCPRTATSAAS
jgi:hypothetical protein